MEEILYKVHNNLYVNLTNKCPCACTFCLRQNMDRIGESNSLWLDHEPSFEEVKAAFEQFNLSAYNEVVFCGFGEPTEALDVLLQTAKFVKNTYKKKIRINTNGLGNLVNNKDITPLFKDLIDTVSISLNTSNADDYHKLVQSKFGDCSFNEMLKFAESCTNYVPNVILTTVETTISKDDEAACQKICDKIGATYRIRPWED
ncbi:TIGR04100 family radical SAM protein [Eubacterium oxidoreducens]|uniref:Radical SAM enzyme, TIGR04100 family n=1 Tax=Eubacterium oxidoreducens TaxID=1732 RepID=A0A1G6AN00_EUBOX|nr:TIGR04100 family radical SAM protein [Eubacterium oxidoreducens]SDB09747.1 radical SAM enzyme, TIGR04100 family [Eubacterium oxidoreducens]